MVGGVALGRQSPRLDRVGEDYRGALMISVGLTQRVPKIRKVVTGQVADRGEY
jgi:hypothetical protein